MQTQKPRLILTACSRCCGDLVLERDHWGERYVCLQCGSEENAPWRPRLAGAFRRARRAQPLERRRVILPAAR